MNKIGFIGYGHMGSVLLKSLISSQAINSKDIVISTRTKSKHSQIYNEFPDIEIVDSNSEVAAKCKRIFICAGTLDVVNIINEIFSHINETTHLITISGGLEVQSIETIFNGKITRLLPTLISEVYEGFTLVCNNHKVDDCEKEFILTILEKIGKVKIVNENQFEVGGFLTSCAPAFIASILNNLSYSAVQCSDFSYEEAYEMILYTLLGTTNLLIKTKENFEQLVLRVATKGGATEQGVRVLEKHLPAVFNELIEKSLVPHAIRMEMTRKQFSEMKATMDIQNL